MRQSVRSGLAALMVAGLAPMADAQQAPSAKTAAPARTATAAPAQPGTTPATAAPARPPAPTAAQLAKLNEVVATVNGEKITRGQIAQFLSQYQIPPGAEETSYRSGLDILINTRLLTQFLNQNRVPVDPAEVEKRIDEQRKAATANGTSLESMLADSGTTLEQMREGIRNTLQWKNFIDKYATDAALKAYMAANPDVFNGTQVKASHIQINLDENASAAEKEKARQSLLKIKKEIESGAITFADAANKYSEDPVNKEQPSGGDLRWFPRKKMTESFSAAAFALKKGAISDPVETEYGMHLIQVTDRKEGKMPAFDQFREKILNQYAVDEQNRIVAEMRKTAKIDIKPMPTDLFGPRPAATAAPAPAATSTPKPAATAKP